MVAQISQTYPLQYLPGRSQGKAATTRRALEQAQGDFIFTLDADDFFLPGKIADSVAIFQQFPQVGHVASPAQIKWINGEKSPRREPLPRRFTGRPLSGRALLKQFMQHKMLYGGGSTFAARGSLLRRMALPDGVDMYTDEWLVIQMLLVADSYFLPEPLSVWNIHDRNYSGPQPPGGHLPRLERLAASSATVLQHLESNVYNPWWLIVAYRLRHAIRQITRLKAAGALTRADRIHFLRHYILSGRYSLPMLWRYRAFNRLLF